MAIDMTWERREVLIRKEEREDGIREGITQGIMQGITQGIAQGEVLKLIMQTCKKLSKGLKVAEIADTLEEEPETIQKIADIAKKYAPDYDAEKILEELNQN